MTRKPKRADRRREGLGYTYHLDECPKRRGSISGCICRDDEHAELTREIDDTIEQQGSEVMTDIAAPRFTAFEMSEAREIAQNLIKNGGLSPYDVTYSLDITNTNLKHLETAHLQAAADLASAPKREELIASIHKGLAGYPLDAESYPMIVQDVTESLIAAGVKVR
ncbi:MAG: hypothetical protein EBR82_58045, partial [Caulobacteraceae bacterium]|nr:hypothetical protein [Caulobacteraceae bacterium]